MQGEHGQAVIEVGPEPPALHLVLEVAVRCGNDPDIHLVNAVAANALNLAVLKRAKQLGLKFERQLTDLVQEKSPAVSHFELARPVAGGAGEGACDVPEKLALGNRHRERRAVDVNERFVAPR